MKHRASVFAIIVSSFAALASAAPRADDDYRRAMQKSPDADAGERLYVTCGGCHGRDGAGRAEEGIPRIGGERHSIVVRQLVDYRHGLRWDERMQANSSEHRLADLQAVTDVAAWVSRLAPAAPVSRQAEGPFAALGRQVYAARCSRCHGARGEGKDDAPRLANQHVAYLRRQIRDAVEGRRPNLSLVHARMLESLDFRETEGVAEAMMRQDRLP